MSSKRRSVTDDFVGLPFTVGSCFLGRSMFSSTFTANTAAITVKSILSILNIHRVEVACAELLTFNLRRYRRKMVGIVHKIKLRRIYD